MLSRLFDHFLGRYPWLWRYRHWWKPSWAADYLKEKSLGHGHRQFLMNIIDKYAPFQEILEFGCGAGANVYLLAKKYPGVFVYGYDISEHAVQEGRELLLRKNLWNAQLYSSLCDILSGWIGLPIEIDIVFTSAVLIYMDSGKAEKNIKNLWDITKKALILCEWHSGKGSFVDMGHWVHNFKELAPGSKITKIPPQVWPDPGWEKYGAIVELRK